MVVGIGLVELEHRELGVVLRRHALVPEVARQLVDPLHAADDQPLQIQLRRDPQVEVHVERVVMRDKRPRRRAAGNRLHHRRLDLDEAARVEERADRGDRAGPHLEDAPAFRRHDQVEVALAVARLDVLQSVPLLGQRQMALGQKDQAAGPDGQLAGLRAEQVALDADVVAEIEQLEDLEVQLGQRVLADVDLDPMQAVGQRDEVRLAEAADGNDAACGDGLDFLGLERLGRPLAEPGGDLADAVRAVEPARIDVHAQGPQRLQVGLALLNLLVE